MTKKCSKCNSEFECNVMDIENCHCCSVSLSEDSLNELKNLYLNCLCEACLKEIEENQ